jgi:hypothetical protein
VKVVELITKLQAMPPDAQVETEGCDCIGQAEGVQFDGDTVLITRTMSHEDRVRSSLLYPTVVNEPVPDSNDIMEDAVKG